MNERDYLKLKARLDADYKRQLDALDTVFRMTGGDPQAVLKSLNAAVSAKGSNGNIPRAVRGVLSTAITSVLPEFGTTEITASRVSEEVRKRNPGTEFNDSSVSSALVRLSEPNGPLELVEAGKGRRPTKYRNKTLEKTG